MISRIINGTTILDIKNVKIDYDCITEREYSEIIIYDDFE